jgi:hypothetical protein
MRSRMPEPADTESEHTIGMTSDAPSPGVFALRPAPASEAPWLWDSPAGAGASDCDDERVTVGRCVGFGVGLGVALGLGVGLGVALGLGVGLGVGFGVGFGVGLGVGVGADTVMLAGSGLLICRTVEPCPPVNVYVWVPAARAVE